MPAKTKDGEILKVVGNIELMEEVSSVLDNGGEGIGLFRTEFLYLRKNKYPKEEELFEQFKEVISILNGKPVVFRTLDINGDKSIEASKNNEKNPALGFRSIRFCLQNIEIFKTQIKAILRASAYGPAKVLFPFISSIEEVISSIKILSDVKEELREKKIDFDENIKIGVMIEIPSAAIMAEELAELVDFFSIGTNDLTQYLLAADRDNQELAYLYNSLHPAVLRTIKSVMDVGKKRNIEVNICGEIADLSLLLGFGIKEISTNSPSIPIIKEEIRNLSIKESKKKLEAALKKKTTQEVYELLAN